MTRILVLGDSHGDLHYMRQAINLAKSNHADVIFQVGDFGVWDHVKAGVTFLDTTNQLADEAGVVVFFVDGNHENFESLYGYPLRDHGFREVRPNILHAPRGHIWRWGEVTFMAMGGAHSIDGPGGPSWWPQGRSHGNGWWPEETITHRQVEEAVMAIDRWDGDIDVMFTHDAPYGTSIPGIKGYPAGDANRKHLASVVRKAKPELLVHGHFHLRYTDFWENTTRVEGLSSNNNPPHNWLMVDTDPFRLTLPKFERVKGGR